MFQCFIFQFISEYATGIASHNSVTILMWLNISRRRGTSLHKRVSDTDIKYRKLVHKVELPIALLLCFQIPAMDRHTDRRQDTVTPPSCERHAPGSWSMFWRRRLGTLVQRIRDTSVSTWRLFWSFWCQSLPSESSPLLSVAESAHAHQLSRLREISCRWNKLGDWQHLLLR